MFAVVKGATLLTPSGSFSRPDLKHLTILLTNPVGAAKQVLTVTVSRMLGGKYDDHACVLDKGDHPFINRPSFVVYRFCRYDCTESAIHEAIANKMFVPMEPIKEDVFARVVAGLGKSLHTPPFAKKFIRNSN